MTRSTDGESESRLTELERLRRRLDPEHPDPERLRRRVQLAIGSQAAAPDTSDAPAAAARDRSAPGPVAVLHPQPTGRRRWSGGTPALVAAVAVLVVLLVAAVVVVRGPLGDRWLEVAATPAPTVPTAPPVSTAAPTMVAPAPAPVGFRDCSSSLGPDALCADPPECWAGVISVDDQPLVGTRADCGSNHVYQTFAAARVTASVDRQSSYEKLALAKRLCSTKTLGTVLGEEGSAERFEILVLPPDLTATERVMRCLAGRGERTGPLDFRLLR